MNREELFLSLVARSRPDKKTKARIKCLSAQGLDWGSVLKTAERQSLFPLLNFNIRHVQKMPEGALKKARVFSNGTLAINLLLFEEAKKIVRALKVEGISTIVLNGIPCAKKYKKDYLMYAGPIDLLVRKEDIAQIEGTLYAEGWETTDMRYPLTKRARLKSGCSLPRFSNGKVELCLYWGIGKRVNAAPLELWDGSKSFSINGVAVRELSAESQIICLCLNSASFRRQGHIQKGLVDLNETVLFYGKDMDWDKLAEKANSWGANKTVHSRLSAAKKLFGNGLIPAEKLNALKRN